MNFTVFHPFFQPQAPFGVPKNTEGLLVIKACWALMATLEGEGVPQYHQKQCLLLDEKLRAGGHMWTVSYKA